MKNSAPLRGSSRLLALLLASGLGLAAPAAAQTVFQWPDTAVDVGTYTTVEECLAAVGRVLGAAERLEALTSWPDTLPWDPSVRMKPAPKGATNAARRCGAQFTASAAPLANYKSYLMLFLAAGRDSDAAALVNRRLQVAREGGVSGQEGAIVDSIVDTLVTTVPPRLAFAERLLEQRAHGVDRILRPNVYGRMMGVAHNCGDTTLSRLMARRVLVAVDSLTPADTESEEFERHYPPPFRVGALLYDAIVLNLGEEIELDSLRHSTTALAALEHAWWHQFTRNAFGGLPQPIGDTAPQLRGEFWYPDSTARTPLPEAGQVSLVVFIPPTAKGAVSNPAEEPGERFAKPFAVLRRLAHRFPALRITIVLRTRGYYSYALMTSPAEEAEWYRRWVLASAPPAVAIVVDSTRFLRLPAADSRWISRSDSNVTDYTFKMGSGVSSLFDLDVQTFLVDQERLVVEKTQLTPEREARLSAMIDVLLHRTASRP